MRGEITGIRSGFYEILVEGKRIKFPLAVGNFKVGQPVSFDGQKFELVNTRLVPSRPPRDKIVDDRFYAVDGSTIASDPKNIQTSVPPENIPKIIGNYDGTGLTSLIFYDPIEDYRLSKIHPILHFAVVARSKSRVGTLASIIKENEKSCIASDFYFGSNGMYGESHLTANDFRNNARNEPRQYSALFIPIPRLVTGGLMRHIYSGDLQNLVEFSPVLPDVPIPGLAAR